MPKKNKMGSYRHLTQADRDRLQALRDKEITQKEIAKILGFDPGTISREIARNQRMHRKRKKVKNKKACYSASLAQHKAYSKRKYAKYQGKTIDQNDDLNKYIVAKLKLYWNPDEISGRMKRDKEPFYASKTAIYAWLRTSLGDRYCKYLYSKRRYVKKQGKGSKKVMIPNRIGIEHRPLGATNRTRYGHYEGDTMLSGKKTKSKAALSIIYERKARFVDARKILSLAPKRFADGVNEMLENTKAVTISLDNGIENRDHEKIIVPAYFCQAYHSWEKGGVEHGIKMFRRFIPKGVDVGKYSDDDVRKFVKILNGKPRKILGYAMPEEVMREKGLFKEKKGRI
jgi:transposase, IS30 family